MMTSLVISSVNTRSLNANDINVIVQHTYGAVSKNPELIEPEEVVVARQVKIRDSVIKSLQEDREREALLRKAEAGR